MGEGEDAEAVLLNPVFKKVAEDYNKELLKAFKGDDLEAAMVAREEARVLERILTRLVSIQGKGERAAAALEELKQRKKKGLPIDANALGGIA